ncbi:MAG TPA: hypothetical protein VFS60_07275 [Thermoanaerobaculia bacterium]|nr:hypothetical protein [Thermoanaerobaculia bacterium]
MTARPTTFDNAGPDRPGPDPDGRPDDDGPRIIIEVPADRGRCASLTLHDAAGQLLAGPLSACVKADELTAEANGNPTRDPLHLYGDTPFGTYKVRGYQACPPGDSEERGPNDRIKLIPDSGDCTIAAGNGRVGFQIHGGRIGNSGRLRPTCGSIRLSDASMAVLLRAVGRRGYYNLPATCVIRRGAGLTDALAPDSGLESQDPPPDLARPVTGVPGQPSPPPFIISFYAFPSTIKKGQTTTLSWHTVFASTVAVDGQSVPANGSLERGPVNNATFQLVARGVGEPASQTVAVEVRLPPPPPPPPRPRPPPTYDRTGHDRNGHDRN